jgi:hypothetical protein
MSKSPPKLCSIITVKEVKGFEKLEETIWKRGVTVCELRASLFAHHCAQLCDDIKIGASYLYHHLRKFGLLMHIWQGAVESKTEAIFFPAQSLPSNSTVSDRTNLTVAGSFVSSPTNSSKYLGITR